MCVDVVGSREASVEGHFRLAFPISPLAWRPGAPHKAVDFSPDSGQTRGFLFFEKFGPFRKLYSRNPSSSRSLLRPCSDRLSYLPVNDRDVDPQSLPVREEMAPRHQLVLYHFPIDLQLNGVMNTSVGGDIGVWAVS
jgi:hypothetical protein